MDLDSPLWSCLQECDKKEMKAQLMRACVRRARFSFFERRLTYKILNAVLHSRTKKGIFSCGQFFYQRKKLDFTVADLGVGMQKNIKTHTGLDLSPEKAIVWATEGNNTTKCGNVPGGLGLKLLSEFIDLNRGCIQIVSDAGYWQRKKGHTFSARLSERFPGTVVSGKINTADTSSYGLASEINAADIF